MASTVLSKTFTASNRKTFTISTWIKRTGLASNYGILGSGTNSSTDRDSLYFESNDYLYFDAKVSSSVVASFQTNRTFKDVGAFYHIVLAFDTTQATDTNRMKLYVNGELQTFSSVTYPNQNRDMNTNNTAHTIGAILGPVYYFDGLMSYFAFTDGTAYDASYFGETDSSSGIWKIKTSPSVTYGTNGFFLKMDTSSPGTDTSGNTNTFTAAGTPTLAQDNASNVFATNNSLCNVAGRWTITNGNNTIQHANGGSWTAMISSIASSVGKYYMEAKITAGASRTMFGVMSADTNIISYATNLTTICLYNNLGNGEFQESGGETSGNNYGTFADNDIAGIALDCTNNKISIYKNGTALVTDHTIPATVDGFIGFGFTSDSNSTIYQCNYGNGFFGTTAVASSNADAAGHGLFEYAVPTGYFSLNTKNLNTYGG